MPRDPVKILADRIEKMQDDIDRLTSVVAAQQKIVAKARHELELLTREALDRAAASKTPDKQS